MKQRLNIDETLIISMQLLSISCVYNVLISQTSIVYRCFIDDFLKKHRCNIEETLMNSTETLKIINDKEAKYFKSSMFY